MAKVNTIGYVITATASRYHVHTWHGSTAGVWRQHVVTNVRNPLGLQYLRTYIGALRGQNVRRMFGAPIRCTIVAS